MYMYMLKLVSNASWIGYSVLPAIIDFSKTLFLSRMHLSLNEKCILELRESHWFSKHSNRDGGAFSPPRGYDRNGGKMAIIDTLFMTKTAEKPYPLGPPIPI